MPVVIRQLVAGDEATLESFLSGRPNNTIFLRSNLRRAGLAGRDDARSYSGTYAGAFDRKSGALLGAAAFYWNGNIVLAGDTRAAALARAVVDLAPGEVRGILGPHAEVVAARAALDLASKPARRDDREVLFALELEGVAVPEPLASGKIVVRAPRDEEMPRLLEFRMHYCMETSRIRDTPETRAEQAAYLARYQQDGDHFVALADGAIVGYSAFNAKLPDVVQIGGVWTPRELRGRGYARCVVAGSLQVARDRGVSRAVLFTAEENPAAQASYGAVGFRKVGDYGIVMF